MWCVFWQEDFPATEHACVERERPRSKKRYSDRQPNRFDRRLEQSGQSENGSADCN